ncbi:MAG TPA: mannose-6-phosphate isomerase, class I [Jatrophihabitans sp.]|nr:mannose-6-phosphate isomerase, class I [Jatrophihabitans sp.]
MNPVALEGAMRRYEWGSPTAIPQLLGHEPDGAPVAELWFGAHPDDPAWVHEHETSLDALIDRAPDAALGAEVISRFGARLPFLLKILAADRPLSIQVHPTREQAEAGFAAEEKAGVPRDAAHRNYRDPHHKPELLCALTPFEALCGFRPVEQTLAVLDELRIPELGFLARLLRGPDPLRRAFAELLTMDDPSPVIDAVCAAASPEGPLRPAHLAAAAFPGDVGIVLTLLLNPVTLQPGEAIFLGAGNVHAYLRGTAVEVMAASDNVLRCGLTPKHVDVAELLRITDFSELAEPRWPEGPEGFAVPVPDFRLDRRSVDGVHEVAVPGPRIALCAAGAFEIGGVHTPAGRAVFLPDDAGPCAARGQGLLFTAAVG